ncbi:MAG: DUF1080 domain-containing protein [Akkermansiaceae bacterium]|jgi:hypothetical protein|nr:DUF1080 domain-containing protein [Akkermansiaceae bacterium]
MKSFFNSLAIIPLVFTVSHAADVLTTRPLFNGKDLSGWKGEGYVVEDGAIVSTPQGRNLITEEIFANYVLDFQFKLSPGANNGLGIHYPGTGDAAYTGMEIQVLDSTHPKYKDLKDYQFHGGLYTLAPAKQGFLKPVGEWNQQRVTVYGPSLKVELNGEVILQANLDEIAAKHPQHQGAKRRAGHIGWLGHGDRVAFRNINIGELPPPANEEAVKAAGFTKIFDGKTLTGWKTTPDTTNWKAIHGILKHDGKPGTIKDLWSEKSYGDITLVFHWRWAGRGPMKSQPIVMPDGTENGRADVEELDSGIYLRGNSKNQVNLWNWTVGSGEVYGYRTDGKMPAEIKAGVTPKAKADHPIGEWNSAQITLKGDLLTVAINGKVVIQEAKLPGIAASGPIGFQHHGAAIDFANIWIKEL